MKPSYIKLNNRLGKYVWVSEDEVENEEPGCQFIQFNGLVPYCVFTEPDNKYIHIYTRNSKANRDTHPPPQMQVNSAENNSDREDDEESEFEIDETDYCFEYLFSYKYDRFVEISHKYSNNMREMCIRPYLAMLIGLSDTRYVLITADCVEFESNTKITESVPEGCGDLCPYWFAFDENYMYAEDDGIVKINKSDIDFTKHPLDPYSNYVYAKLYADSENPIVNYLFKDCKRVDIMPIDHVAAHTFDTLNG